MTEKQQNPATKAAHFMARADVFSWALLWLMTLLVAGTLSEKSTGLYMAQKTYFSSGIFWLGIVPLPGVMLTVTFIFMGMICKLALDKWHWSDLGTIVMHIGAAVLLFGGFLTAHFSSEGSMVIPQGESRAYVESNDEVELAVIDQTESKDIAFSFDKLKAGTILSNSAIPFAIETVSWCRNCGLERLKQPVTEGNPHGVAINFVLHSIPRDPVDENNRSGLTFRLKNAGDKDGLYAVFEDMPIPEIVDIKGHQYLIAMRNVRTPLPFSVRLIHFKQTLYPGTNKPKAYESEVVVDDHGAQWRSLIRMNEPLRYKGYTLYQASYLEGAPQATTVLAVVRNIGRLFPYIASIVICIGMLIHLFQRLPVILRERPKA
ncbi:MAG TPA: cytochrome c biogenesis protein ResB [Patescibacteria group bacterium]|nr:cytochrome c biogenesis protein ResB [Patescibacteria group bacterium]